VIEDDGFAAQARGHGLSRPAADQGIVHALVQATNSSAVVSLLVDFEMGSEKKFRRKLLDRETDSVRSVRKTSVPNWLSPRFPIAGGEKLSLGAVIKSDFGFFDHGCVCHLIISNKKSIEYSLLYI
jgi:hypothetical protein